MKNLNKTIGKVGMLFLASVTSINAQDVTTVEATSEEISENLNLEAIASIFGDSKDLEEFEHKLNDPETQISNLDLNEDGNVDYLRVVETSEKDTHLIAIQSVLGEDIYQDIATVEVEKDADGKTQVQVVGDVYLYGPGYIVQPVYVHRPVIFSWFWRPYYRPYRSVYYWGYYPKHYHFWKPFHVNHYKKNVHVHVNVKHTYNYTKVRHSTKAVHLHTTIKRNDYAVKHPHKAHSVRTARVRKSNGSKVRTTRVTKANGTKKRATAVKKSDGSRKSVAVKKNPDGSKRAVAVKKNANGNRTVKTAGRSSSITKKVKAKTTSSKKRVVKRK